MHGETEYSEDGVQPDVEASFRSGWSCAKPDRHSWRKLANAALALSSPEEWIAVSWKTPCIGPSPQGQGRRGQRSTR